MQSNSPVLEPLLLREKEAAAICGVSPRTWRDWRASGKVPPSHKIGGSVFWKTEDIKLWVKMDMPNLDKFRTILEDKKGRHR